jgi:formylglycine-generating enzyme required for sulfatase activity
MPPPKNRSHGSENLIEGIDVDIDCEYRPSRDLLAFARVTVLAVLLSQAASLSALGGEAGVGKPGSQWADCLPAEGCPRLVTVPAAPEGVTIGSPSDERSRQPDEQLHRVTLRPFAIGAYEVTVGEYQACVAAGGCRPPEWLEPGSPHNIETGTSRYYKNLGAALTDAKQPIVGVSHDDAVAFTAWLTRKTGHRYRLPSEAEWEYAARAGAQTPYWWGSEPGGDGRIRANCRGCGSRYDGQSPGPVDSFDANPWGLYNVHGNVWEWVADIYCEDYSAHPADGAPHTIDDCPKPGAKGLRVLRGGSAFFESHLMRASVRLRNKADFRNFSVGFRVARDIAS